MTHEPPAAFVFDAYGTLFDVHSVSVVADELAPGRGDTLSRAWRAKQLEYTWLSSLMHPPEGPPRERMAQGRDRARGGPVPRRRRRDFDDLTARALDHAAAALGIRLGREAKRRLCAAYLALAPYPDARGALAALVPRPRLILSNGTAKSLETLVQASGLAPLLNGVLSVDEVDVYKPSPRVYAMAEKRLGLPARRIGFVSSNCWDAVGAQSYGFTAFWINRSGAPVDRHGTPPRHILRSLSDLRELVGG
jgi:2-haloacid dehalogenase